MTIQCVRVGLMGVDEEPQDAIAAFLNHMEALGATIISVSVMATARAGERYEVYVVFRGAE